MSEEVAAASSDEIPVAEVRAGPGKGHFHEVWLALSRMPWKSLALVPVDPDGSSVQVATGLAEAGSQLSDGQVTMIVAEALDSPSAAKAISNRIASMQQGGRASQLLVALQPVAIAPLGVVIARKADGAILCVRLGESRLADTRHAISLIGPERVAGVIIVG